MKALFDKHVSVIVACALAKALLQIIAYAASEETRPRAFGLPACICYDFVNDNLC